MEFDDDFMMLLSLFIKKISMNEVMYKCIILFMFVFFVDRFGDIMKLLLDFMVVGLGVGF